MINLLELALFYIAGLFLLLFSAFIVIVGGHGMIEMIRNTL